jgi:hypothetical protein
MRTLQQTWAPATITAGAATTALRWSWLWGQDSLSKGTNYLCLLGSDYQTATTNAAGTGTPFLGKVTVQPIYRITALTEIPTPLSPLSGTINLLDTVSFSWKGVSGASSYTLEIAQDSTFDTGLLTVKGITAFSHTDALAFSGAYFWRIRAENPAAFSAWSPANSFSTQVLAVAPKSPNLSAYAIMYSHGSVCYTIPRSCFIHIAYYDMQGRLAASLVNAVQAAGTYTLKTTNHFLSSGTYVQVFTAGDYTRTSKIHVAN